MLKAIWKNFFPTLIGTACISWCICVIVSVFYQLYVYMIEPLLKEVQIFAKAFPAAPTIFIITFICFWMCILIGMSYDDYKDEDTRC